MVGLELDAPGIVISGAPCSRQSNFPLRPCFMYNLLCLGPCLVEFELELTYTLISFKINVLMVLV
jgi:hypothetical protein